MEINTVRWKGQDGNVLRWAERVAAMTIDLDGSR